MFLVRLGIWHARYKDTQHISSIGILSVDNKPSGLKTRVFVTINRFHLGQKVGTQSSEAPSLANKHSTRK